MSCLFALRNVRDCVNIQTCKLLYYTLIYPYLSCGLHLWGCTFKTFLNTLIILQKRAIRIIAGVSRLENTMPLFIDLHILRIVNLYDFCLGQCMYKQIQQRAHVTIISEVFNRDIYRYSTRGSERVHVLYWQTQKVPNSFVNTFSHYCHSLPANIILQRQSRVSIGNINLVYSVMPWLKFSSII